MKRISLIALIVLLFLNTAVFAKGFNTIPDSSGQIVYLEIYKDLSGFFADQTLNNFENNLKLKTIFVSDFKENDHWETLFPSFISFLRNNCSELENLHFRNSNKSNRGLELKHLIQVLKSVKSSPLKNFSWENQAEIDDDKSFHHILDNPPVIFSKLRTLSFRGTEFDRKNFFLPKIFFDSLQTLDLSYSLNSDRFYVNLINAHDKFPVLTTLKIDGEDLRLDEGLSATKPFPNLHKLSIILEDYDTEDYLELISQIPALFQNLDTLKIKLELEKPGKCNSSGEFVLKKDHSLCKDNTGQNQEIFEKLPTLKTIGNFTRFYSTSLSVSGFPINIESNPGIFFSKPAELEYFKKAFPNSERESITLAGPFISKSDVDFILENRKTFGRIRNIFLVGTSCRENELSALRNKAHKLSIRIHKVDRYQSAQLTSSFDFDFMFQQMQFQQFMNQNIQRSIKQSIPKFK